MGGEFVVGFEERFGEREKRGAAGLFKREREMGFV